MALVPTKTKITITGVDLGIYTWYQALVQGLEYLVFWINGDPQIVNKVSFIEGQLGYTIENNSDLFFINSDGCLVVSSQNPTAYSIDSNGDINYTY